MHAMRDNCIESFFKIWTTKRYLTRAKFISTCTPGSYIDMVECIIASLIRKKIERVSDFQCGSIPSHSKSN